MLRSRVEVPILLALSVFGLNMPAQAGFKVCNTTDHATAIAIGYQQRGAWISEGWWRIEPRKCQEILSNTLRGKYYYLRGVHLGVEGPWEGSRYFCVAAGNFTIKGRKDCAKRGYGQAGFFEIDTGKELTWVHNLSD